MFERFVVTRFIGSFAREPGRSAGADRMNAVTTNLPNTRCKGRDPRSARCEPDSRPGRNWRAARGVWYTRLGQESRVQASGGRQPPDEWRSNVTRWIIQVIRGLTPPARLNTPVAAARSVQCADSRGEKGLEKMEGVDRKGLRATVARICPEKLTPWGAWS